MRDPFILRPLYAIGVVPNKEREPLALFALSQDFVVRIADMIEA